MRTLRRSEERDHQAQAFRGLVLLNEERLPPGGSLSSAPPQGLEILTYVREGALSFQDSSGGSGILQAGEFRCTTAGRHCRRDESNASRTDSAQVFQMFLRPGQADLEPSEEQRRFSAAERRGGFRVVAAPDGRRGSLRLHSDSLVYSALLDLGKHVVHALAPGRGAWVHVVKGAVMFDELLLSTGDGAGITDDRAVSLTAREETELLLLDV